MGQLIDFESHLPLDQRIDNMLRRITRDDGSVDDAKAEAEHERLMDRIRDRSYAVSAFPAS
jgi:hypothetical protein